MLKAEVVEGIAAKLMGACWSCSQREHCEIIGHSLVCDFRNARKCQRTLNLGGGDFAQRDRGVNNMS